MIAALVLPHPMHFLHFGALASGSAAPATLMLSRSASKDSLPGPHSRVPRVIVLGAGPVGLAIAGALRDRGFEVSVFEKRDSIPLVGGVIQLHIEGIAALRMLRSSNLRKLFIENCETVIRAVDITDLRDCSESDPTGKRLHHISLVERYGDSGILCTMRRSRLVSILRQTLRGDLPVGSKNCQRIVPGDVIKVEFQDGTEVEGEVLIAADGAHSAVRTFLFPEAKFESVHAWCIGGVASLPTAHKPVIDYKAREQILQMLGNASDEEDAAEPVAPRKRVTPPPGARFRLGTLSDDESPNNSMGGAAAPAPEPEMTDAVADMMHLLETHDFVSAFAPNYRLYTCKCDSRSVGWYLSLPFDCPHLAKLTKPPWSREEIRQLLNDIAAELKSSYNHRVLQSLLACTPIEGEDSPFVWEQGDVPPVKSYALNNIALVGDAAHCMLAPNPVGQGVNQGLCDAAVLVDLMDEELQRVRASDVAKFNINSVLSLYSHRRHQLTVEFQQALHASHVPFGRWPFFARVVRSDSFLNTALAPFDKYTRLVVDRAGSIDAFKGSDSKWLSLPVAMGAVTAIVLAVFAYRLLVMKRV